MRTMVMAALVCAAAVTASAGLYNSDLLADGSFEVWEAGNNTWVYYWNVGTKAIGAEAPDPVYDGSKSLKIMSNSNYQEDGVSVNDTRNQINENLSYNAGDTVEMSLMVNVCDWDVAGAGKGIAFRLVTKPTGGTPSVAVVSDYLKDTDGQWQMLSKNYTFENAFEGTLTFEVRYDHSQNTNSSVTEVAFVDSASMTVVPEPMTLSLLALGSAALIRRKK